MRVAAMRYMKMKENGDIEGENEKWRMGGRALFRRLKPPVNKMSSLRNFMATYIYRCVRASSLRAQRSNPEKTSFD